MLQGAYRALEVLSKHPRIDPNRIAIMGFSKGGVAGLYASLERFQQAYAPANANFSAYIAFYAGCTTYIDDEKVSNHPIRVYHGAADDWVPPTTCRDYITRLRAQGRDAQFIEFPGAHHAFDKPDEKAPTALPQAQAFRKCRWAENPRGTIINAETGQVFGPNDPCLERGVHVGFDPAAAAAARASVKEFLKATFLLQ
jgi:dienelactone hydrolase